MQARLQSMSKDSLRSKRFRGAKSEERGFPRFARAKNGTRAKITPPPPSYFCFRPIYRAGKTPKTPFFALCSTETLATQASQKMAHRKMSPMHVTLKVGVIEKGFDGTSSKQES